MGKKSAEPWFASPDTDSQAINRKGMRRVMREVHSVNSGNPVLLQKVNEERISLSTPL
ncbi:hypothetical protein [Leptothoe sp. PORK10 BA2]|uniref:hypothetical protein n=1 Tax=Leptothoe sp. PORK10 BA2 TaxID=3110254 RepID=UPI002B1F365C|nr:hypothetical protein [Leptothoe sp. PORK10 BA2]MEA5467110.1 hypothetical protein [Leptothoe sp. PORK10 BA2]